eukprot:TRINITY_DN7290_c0_g1_i1.p1 TRINITY_DN7290_c0_g1~~TRINITY_DN7290_c0_g1_i1.p1  ORF type:complete len:134 (-),score=20.62 TRINITY_DN7290_c0_g1_i1:245-646(-)
MESSILFFIFNFFLFNELPGHLGDLPIPRCKQEAGFVGDCKGELDRWTYVQQWGCYLFQYGGCGGNQNSFMTKAECQDVCETGAQIIHQGELGRKRGGSKKGKARKIGRKEKREKKEKGKKEKGKESPGRIIF